MRIQTLTFSLMWVTSCFSTSPDRRYDDARSICSYWRRRRLWWQRNLEILFLRLWRHHRTNHNQLPLVTGMVFVALVDIADDIYTMRNHRNPLISTISLRWLQDRVVSLKKINQPYTYMLQTSSKRSKQNSVIFRKKKGCYARTNPSNMWCIRSLFLKLALERVFSVS